MAKITAFDKFGNIYDSWFDDHPDYYKLELQAVKELLPKSGNGVEIGIGSGKFALPLGIKLGVEPSELMMNLAKQKGLEVIKGVAESLPLETGKYDFSLMVTTICFVDDPVLSFNEIFRILKPGGAIIVAFVDKTSPMGKIYLEKKSKSKFYKEARFYSTTEVLDFLKIAGFENFKFRQTLFNTGENLVKHGFEHGSFIVIKAFKQIRM